MIDLPYKNISKKERELTITGRLDGLIFNNSLKLLEIKYCSSLRDYEMLEIAKNDWTTHVTMVNNQMVVPKNCRLYSQI